MAGYAYINPLAGLNPHTRDASYHAMAGYAYINPLAIPLCYRGLCLHQPLSGVDPSHPPTHAHYVMVGYVYINPLAGLSHHILRRTPTMVWWVMPTSTP